MEKDAFTARSSLLDIFTRTVDSCQYGWIFVVGCNEGLTIGRSRRVITLLVV